MKRRDFLKSSAAIGSISTLYSLAQPREIFAAEPVEPLFVLYLHLGSICGMASGLVQAPSAGKWGRGFFVRQSDEGASNPLLNQHTANGSMVFHDYNKFLAEIADDMCLMNGTPQSLDHNVARPLQMKGQISSPEWALASSQAAISKGEPAKLIVSRGQKASKTPDARLVQAANIEELKRLSSDPNSMPQVGSDSIWAVLKQRYQKKAQGSVKLNSGFGDNVAQQIQTLTNGLPELNTSTEAINRLSDAMSDDKLRAVLNTTQDGANVNIDQRLKNLLILAGTLAKTDLAQGMTADGINGHDFHNGGADVISARQASGFWAQIKLFWQWLKEEGLDKKVSIIVSHEFGRSPYNDKRNDQFTIRTADGERQVIAPGRDHGLFMGTMFLNANVPSAARIGNVTDNLTPVYGTDKTGSFDAGRGAFTSEDMVGSMFMRLYPKLFPNERDIRHFYPTFSEIPAVLS